MTLHRIARLSSLALVTVALASFAAVATAQDSLGVSDSLPPLAPNSPAGGIPSLLGPTGTWHLLPTTIPEVTPRHGQSSVYNPVAGKIYEFGGVSAVTATVILGDLIAFEPCNGTAWQKVAASGLAPSPRFGHSAIYDPVRQRMIVYGGYDNSTVSNQLFSLSLAGTPTWAALSVSGGPGPRYGHTAIYDPVRDRMIVFGGFDGFSFHNDVWALNLSGSPAWTNLAPSGAGPSNRDYASAIYDPVRDRMLVFGGNSGPNFNDLYELSLGASPAWTPIAAAGSAPSPRLAHCAAYDPASDAMVVIGGTTPFVVFNDVNVLRLSGAGAPAWSQPAALGDPVPAGHSRGAVMLPGGTIVCHGGSTFTASGRETDAIRVSGASFVNEALQGVVAGRNGQTLTVDPVRRRMIMHGGQSPTMGDLLVMPLDGPGVWSEPCVVGPRPAVRHGHSAVYDPIRDRVVMFGGFAGSLSQGNYSNELWQLSLGTPMSWSPVVALGSPPAGRDYASLVYDSVRDRLVMFGGNNAGGYRNDVWELSLSGAPTWTQLSPAGTPPSPRLAHRALYDAARDRMLVHAGFDGAENGELWALEFSPTLQWVQLSPGGPAPDPRHSESLVYDSSRDRLILFGGTDGSTSRNDLWELPLSGGFTWAPITAPPQTPLPRHGHGGIYDPVNDLMVIAGGFRSGVDVQLNDTWVLNWGSFATPTLVSLMKSSVEIDRVRLTWEWAGSTGRAATVLRRETGGSWQSLGTAVSSGDLRTWDDFDVRPGAHYGYALDLGEGPQAAIEVDIPVAPRLSFAGVFPTPASGAARIAFSLPAPSPVRIDVFDVAGRRVGGEDLGAYPAGSHRVPLASLSHLSPGVYTLRLVTRSGSLEARATRVR